MPRTVKFTKDCAHAGSSYTKGDVAAMAVFEAEDAVEKGLADFIDDKKAKSKNRAVDSSEVNWR